MASNRLFLMVYYLLEKGISTAPELAAHFEVSVRTIYRDIDILSAAGIPVYATQGKGGGDNQNFNILKRAVFQHKKVTFLYYGTNGESADRIVEPLKLVFKSREWYLYAYCCQRSDYRFFKLTRMKKLLLTEQDFHRDVPAQVFRQMEPHTEPMIALSLLFDRDMGYSVYDHFDRVTRREDGSFYVEVSLPENEWMFLFLLSFGDKAEVLHPQSVREELKLRIKKMLSKYKT